MFPLDLWNLEFEFSGAVLRLNVIYSFRICERRRKQLTPLQFSDVRYDPGNEHININDSSEMRKSPTEMSRVISTSLVRLQQHRVCGGECVQVASK